MEQAAVTNPATTILEFHDQLNGGPAKGLVLPTVQTPTGSEGAILFNGPAGVVQYHNGTAWVAMSPASAAAPYVTPATADVNTMGTVISDNTVTEPTTDAAVLKLESTSKAMILPRVSNVETALSNPAPGTMVYDVASKSIAIFNGEVWSFWN
ncbi:MAG: hypothetical protein Q4G27_10310 [Flavobacteriaceae bacterium]|nr:hypothetical protein [Flavobacteriaceae bacterium]